MQEQEFNQEVESTEEYTLIAEPIPKEQEYTGEQPEPTPEPEPKPTPKPEPEPTQEPTPEPEPQEPTQDDEPTKKTRKPYTKRNKDNLIDDIKKDYKPKEDKGGQVITVGKNKQKVDLSKYVSGTLLIMLIDSLLPNLMLYVAKYIAPEKYKNSKVSELQMTFEERKQIEPLANEVIVVLIGELSPLEAFLIFTAVIYGSKMLTL
jgi:hypothetical protein